MQDSQWIWARSVWAQVVLVTLGSIALTYLAIALDFYSVVNSVWLLGLPIGVAVFANHRTMKRIILGLFLVTCSLAGFFWVIAESGCC